MAEPTAPTLELSEKIAQLSSYIGYAQRVSFLLVLKANTDTTVPPQAQASIWNGVGLTSTVLLPTTPCGH